MSREEFLRLVYLWAERIGVKERIKEVHIRPMKRKLASCSRRGRLTFDPSVLEKDTKDEIIVHELLHLRYPHHGKRFKRLLQAYLQKYGKLI